MEVKKGGGEKKIMMFFVATNVDGSRPPKCRQLVPIRPSFQQCDKIMEGVEENEPNTIEINVGSTMTKDEVVAEIMQRIEHLRC